jgi:hypothetical protein
MRTIDNDIKKQQDEINEIKNSYTALSKKDGSNFLTQDIATIIYSNSVDANIFVESNKNCTQLTTVIFVVHK